VATEAARPAFYALAPGGWRDYLTLLHPPYTAWHLSYVAIGAALAPQFSLARLLPTLAAFFLAVGIGAHALDELNGRPLETQIPRTVLVVLSAVSIVAAAAIGVVGLFVVGPALGVFVVWGLFIVIAYNLELFGGRFHGDFWFSLSWGSFPFVTGYFAVAETIDFAAGLGALSAFALSLAQRRLSTQVREVRRRVARVRGTIERKDGSAEALTEAHLIGAAEAALRALSFAVVALAAALVAMRLM
jgi:hypothetical protein